MSVAISFDRASLEDARWFSKLMREEDRQEVLALGETLEGGLMQSIHLSLGDVWIVRFNGEPAALFGIVTCSILTGYVVPWLVTTKVIDQFPKTFFTLSRRILHLMRHRYALMGNHVDARYEKALRWVRRLGFSVHAAQALGPNKTLFHPVTMEGF